MERLGQFACVSQAVAYIVRAVWLVALALKAEIAEAVAFIITKKHHMSWSPRNLRNQEHPLPHLRITLTLHFSIISSQLPPALIKAFLIKHHGFHSKVCLSHPTFRPAPCSEQPSSGGARETLLEGIAFQDGIVD